MNSLKFILIYLVVFVSVLLHSQSLPYLNASAGNTGAPVVDKDTNVVLFHKDIIEKLDKNYNSIWKKSYYELNFHSLLLSKTGSIYFIASDISSSSNSNYNLMGKIDTDGNLIWCKHIDSTKETSVMSPILSIDAQQLFLDRNNNLMISGNTSITSSSKSFIMKMDTNGNVLKYKLIRTDVIPHEFKIINDSSGIYTIVAKGQNFEYDFISRSYFSDVLDSIILTRGVGTIPVHESTTQEKIFKSKHDPNIYYIVYAHVPLASPTYNFRILKYYKNTCKWSRTYTYYGVSLLNWENLDEDENKNVFISFSTGPVLSSTVGPLYTKYALKTDSNGTMPFQKINFINEYHASFTNSNDFSSSLLCVKPNNFLYYADGSTYAYSPTFVPLNSTLSTSCTMVESFTLNLGLNYNLNYPSTFFSSFIPFSHTINSHITPVIILPSAFFHDNCKTVSIEEYEKLSVSLYPNPTNNLVTIITDDDIKSLTIYNALGVKINFVQMNANTIDIKSFASGLYYLGIKTSKGIVTRKIIKE